MKVCLNLNWGVRGVFIIIFVETVQMLQVYAGSFFVIPLVRWFFISKTNAEIEKRNRARKQRARALELPDPSLRRKVNMGVFILLLCFLDYYWSEYCGIGPCRVAKGELEVWREQKREKSRKNREKYQLLEYSA